MSRPFKCRCIGCEPGINYFKPRGISSAELKEVVLSLDELEAIRLADFEGLYQEEAAKRMGISRQTLGRIVESAHKKVCDAIINLKALDISGGNYVIGRSNQKRCCRCNNKFMLTENISNRICPKCKKLKI